MKQKPPLPPSAAASSELARASGSALLLTDTPPLSHSHLKFHLGLKMSALLPTHYVQEAIIVSAARITPMPSMPAAMLGLLNRRSQVLWVCDLALLLGLPASPITSQQYRLVLLQVGSSLLGLRVNEVDGIVNVPLEQLQPPPANVPSSLLPFLLGCWLQGSEVLLGLDADAIVRSPLFQPN